MAKTSQNMQVMFGDLNFGTFWLISRDPGQIFQNRFLCWNRELKPVVLSTINLINGTIFFWVIKGAGNIKGGQVRDFPTKKQFNSFCNVFIWPNVTKNVRGWFLNFFYEYKGGATPSPSPAIFTFIKLCFFPATIGEIIMKI